MKADILATCQWKQYSRRLQIYREMLIYLICQAISRLFVVNLHIDVGVAMCWWTLWIFIWKQLKTPELSESVTMCLVYDIITFGAKTVLDFLILCLSKCCADAGDRIITDCILTQFHIYVYIYLVTASFFRICTRETCEIPSYSCIRRPINVKFLQLSNFQ